MSGTLPSNPVGPINLAEGCNVPTVEQCRAYASNYKALAADPLNSARRSAVLKNISQSWTALSHQLEKSRGKVWYTLYKSIEKHTAVEYAQRDFLLMRDYACLVVLATVGFGIAAFVELAATRLAALYVVAMIAQSCWSGRRLRTTGSDLSRP
jgi:hypothetical protein